MLFKLRQYQEDAVRAGLTVLKTKKNGLLVEPTGTGKSLIVAEIVRRSKKKTIVLQPSKEILDQNVKKIKAFGVTDIGIFSASMNEKTIGKVTYATIGTIIKHKEKFKNFELIIVDEAHLINSKGGQYEDFITSIGKPVIGLTATPFRMRYYMNSFGNGDHVVESRFLTRTRPRIFSTILHITQVPDMFEQGYLCPVKHDPENDYDSKKIRSNSTGQGYEDNALLKYNESKSIVDKMVDTAANSTAKHILMFTHFREESKEVIQKLAKLNIECVEISGKTKKKDRERILEDFQNGMLRYVVNVGVLTVGFDFPGLDHIIIGRPMKSLALFYQICGRGVRVFLDKMCRISDLCDNVKRFGEINSFVIEDVSYGKGLWRLKSNKGYLTGVNLVSGEDLENRQMNTAKDKKLAEKGDLLIPFGKHNGIMLKDLDKSYMSWCTENFDKGNKWKGIFKREIKRRLSV